jgi:hypothetical protein
MTAYNTQPTQIKYTTDSPFHVAYIAEISGTNDLRCFLMLTFFSHNLPALHFSPLPSEIQKKNVLSRVSPSPKPAELTSFCLRPSRVATFITAVEIVQQHANQSNFWQQICLWIRVLLDAGHETEIFR